MASGPPAPQTEFSAAANAADGSMGSALPLWLRRLLPGSVLFVVTLVMLRPVNDPDTFWHIATGDWLRETWRFSGPDPWSPAATQTWTLHEWMPEIVLSYAQQLFGLVGVAWLMPLGAAAVALALLAACREHASLLVSSIVVTLAIVAMSGSLSLRPQLVTFALTAVTLATWLRSAADLRARWWLVPVTWIWACSHGMWFMAVIIGLVILVGIALDRACTVGEWLRLAAVPFASLAAAALTPAGPRLLLAPLEVRAYTQYVQEWEPPSLGDFQFVVLIVLAAIPIVIWLRGDKRIRWTALLVLGFGVVLGLMYARTVAVGAVLIAPVAAGAIQQVMPQQTEPVERREWLVRVVAVGLALAVAAGLAPSRASEPGRVPNGLNDALDALPTGTVVCNEYSLGGWLIWRHPGLLPTIDGRTEVYSVSHVENYVDFVRAAPNWKAYVSGNKCTTALLPQDAPAVEALVERSGWHVISMADDRVLLAP